MYKLTLALIITCACGGNVAQDTPVPHDASSSTCVLPERGNIGVPCSNATPAAQSWVWLNTSQAGEQSQRCNEFTCPAGATCVVQSDVSGQDDGGELLFGTCQ